MTASGIPGRDHDNAASLCQGRIGRAKPTAVSSRYPCSTIILDSLRTVRDQSIVDELLVNARPMPHLVCRWMGTRTFGWQHGSLMSAIAGIREKPDSASQGSCDDPQVSWVLTARVFKKVAYVRSPHVQRFSTFREELVPLIYGRNP